MADLVVPSRFRTRLAAAFVLVAGVLSGLLALGSFLSIQEYRHRAFSRHAHEAARLGLLSAPPDLSLDSFELLDQFRSRAGFETVGVVGDVVYSSSPDIDAAHIPEALRDLDRGELADATATVGGISYLVIGGTTADGTSRLYFFFDRRDVLDSVRQARNVLVVGWLVAMALAALVGHLVARRTLLPVAHAAAAAQSLADGLLQTRLPATGNDEFGTWALSFNRMASALEDKIEALSTAAERERRFTADVAHELRTPLTGMLSAASLLAEDLDRLPAEGRHVAELLIADVRRLEGLVKELLELARLDAGQEEVHLETLSLGEALTAVVRDCEDRPRMSVGAGDDLRVVADRARFRRVVSNLLANAAGHGGGEVEVVARREGDVVAVDVLDRGPGLAQSDLERVFERFYKADGARAGGGSGLGLSIALENARLQGGSLEAANRPDGGARFTLRLRAGPASDPPGRVEPQANGVPASGATAST
jgi:signal transduction histidine kinase